MSGAPCQRLRNRLASLDRRVLIAIVSLVGIAIWQITGLLLLAASVLALMVVALFPHEVKKRRHLIKVYAVFLLFWGVMKGGATLWATPGDLHGAILESAVMTARLLTLVCLGLVLSFGSTPCELGRAFGWFLQPLMGKSAWKAALALTIMLSFMPRLIVVFQGLHTHFRLRRPRIGLRARAVLFGIAVMRVLSMQSRDLAMAVAARDLYRPDPWRYRKPDTLSSTVTRGID